MQGKLGMQTAQKSAQLQKPRFDVLLCEQPEGRKNQFYKKFPSFFDQKGESKNHVVNTNLKYPLCPIQEKGGRIPMHIQDKVQADLSKLLSEGHTTKLAKCTSEKDDSIKLALDAKPINRQLYNNKYQMPNKDELLDGVSQIVISNTFGTLYFTVLDLK